LPEFVYIFVKQGCCAVPQHGAKEQRIPCLGFAWMVGDFVSLDEDMAPCQRAMAKEGGSFRRPDRTFRAESKSLIPGRRQQGRSGNRKSTAFSR
jgi:hypothetical protein